MTELLHIRDLHAGVEGKEILKGIDLTINRGEVHVLLGPNGSGKSTLMNIIMGHPKYKIFGGTIDFCKEDILDLPTFERARRGIFLSFQMPEEIPGITVENMLRTAKQAISGEKVKAVHFKKELKKVMEALNMDESYATRYVNVGFSGGEKKRHEILQLLMLKPKLALLDETDSGLDVDAVRIVASGVKSFQNKDNATFIITHSTRILDEIAVDKVHVLVDGRFVEEGKADLIDDIQRRGFTHLLASREEGYKDGKEENLG